MEKQAPVEGKKLACPQCLTEYRDMDKPRLINPEILALLDLYFQKNPGERAALNARRMDEDISDGEFLWRYRKAAGLPNKQTLN